MINALLTPSVSLNSVLGLKSALLTLYYLLGFGPIRYGVPKEVLA